MDSIVMDLIHRTRHAATSCGFERYEFIIYVM